jgi:hypothetical protein
MSAAGAWARPFVWVAAVLASLLCGCANGDFGRIRPTLVGDDIHAWIGSTAAQGYGVPVSDFPLTDDERLLRDLAYPLIEPPYDRQRWYAVLNEYGIGRFFRREWSLFEPQAYGRALFAVHVRSQAARYARLNDDIRNDRTRIPQFFAVARRVLDLDRRRAAALVVGAPPGEPDEVNAAARNAENALVVSWVQWSLAARAFSYRRALERLAVTAPMTAAYEVEQPLTALQNQINGQGIMPGPDLAAGAGTTFLPPFQGPVARPI